MAPEQEQRPNIQNITSGCRRVKNRTGFAMFLNIIKQIWLVVRTIIDQAIDWFFSLAIYDDTKKKILPKVKDDFILDSAVALARKIRQKEVKAETVVRAFIKRIEQVNPLINAVVDSRFDSAIKEAQNVDTLLNSEYSVQQLEKEKPFLGVPFTTKETTCCEGLNFTFGLLSRKKVKGVEDAELVKRMKEAGGILLGVSNVPELNLWCETRNNLYGQTLNPYNTTRTVGGSSGGEASLVASCGSPLGIGTDIGGSIRMPAFYCGVYGHKPTTGLTPLKGTTRRTGDEKDTMCTAGPITKHCEDLVPFLKVLIKDKLSLVHLDEEVDLKNLKIFYMEQSNDLRASSVCSELTQVLRRVAEHCEEVTEKPCKKVELYGTQFSYRLWRYWMTKEPYQFSEELGNRERQVCLFEEAFKKVIGRCEFTLAALFKLADHYLPQEKPEWAEYVTEKLRHEVLDLLGDDGVLLYPSHSFPASYHYTSFLRPFNFGFWAIFNVLNLPVTQVPLGLSRDGLPLGIQVVAGPYNDHLCLAVAKEIEKTFGGWVPPFSANKSTN